MIHKPSHKFVRLVEGVSASDLYAMIMLKNCMLMKDHYYSLPTEMKKCFMPMDKEEIEMFTHTHDDEPDEM